MVKHILITGASGLVGTRLTQLLLQRGYSVAHLGRAKKNGSVKSFIWNVENFVIEPGALKGITTIIHLAGANVGEQRWTEKRKKQILDSRVKSTALLYEELKKGHHHVTSFITASAIGYYGIDNTDKIFTESDPPAHDFMAEVTKHWEDEADKIKTLDIRLVKFRTGIVLSDKGGALMEMARPVKYWVGAPIGTGQQKISWIHIDDLCEMYITAIEDEQMNGAFNAVSPHPVSNLELTRAIAQVLHKPLVLPFIPSFILKIVLGEMATYVLNGSIVSAEKIQRAGFQFKFADLNMALSDLLRKNEK